MYNKQPGKNEFCRAVLVMSSKSILKDFFDLTDF